MKSLKEDMSKNDKVVYLHKDKDGVVRYVGHGAVNRPNCSSVSKRSKAWFDVFPDAKPDIEVIAEGLSYREALDLEIKMIVLLLHTMFIVIDLPTIQNLRCTREA